MTYRFVIGKAAFDEFKILDGEGRDVTRDFSCISVQINASANELTTADVRMYASCDAAIAESQVRKKLIDDETMKPPEERPAREVESSGEILLDGPNVVISRCGGYGDSHTHTVIRNKVGAPDATAPESSGAS